MKRIFIIYLLIITLTFMIGMATRKEELQTTITPSYPNYQTSSMVALSLRDNAILYQINMHQKMLPASLTKVLTAILAINLYQLNDYVIITKEMTNIEGSRVYLEEGDVISVEDLLYGLMLCSGNDCAMALALHYSGNINDFIVLMNEMSTKIGMTNSNFNNPHGLDEETTNYTTAYDLGLLFSYAMKNETFRTITKTKKYQKKIYSEKQIYYRNKHRLIHTLPSVIGGKTGYTKKAKRTLITCFNYDDYEFVIVTLNAVNDWNIHQDLSTRIAANL